MMSEMKMKMKKKIMKIGNDDGNPVMDVIQSWKSTVKLKIVSAEIRRGLLPSDNLNCWHDLHVCSDWQKTCQKYKSSLWNWKWKLFPANMLTYTFYTSYICTYKGPLEIQLLFQRGILAKKSRWKWRRFWSSVFLVRKLVMMMVILWWTLSSHESLLMKVI